MHGDGKLKNIILKEEDYLGYSNKFPLIENYIKGLFSTKTILFVGYSAEDSDFKLLFQVVKDQLDVHFQPAYLLENNKKEDRINFNYYKNRGINILYYDEISDEINLLVGSDLNTDITHPIGIKLFNFLKYIKDYRDDENNSFIDKVYNKLKIFEEMNAVTPDDIMKVIGNKCIYDHLALDDLFFLDCKELSTIVSNIKNNEKKEEAELLKNELLKNPNTIKILRILDKASIKNISVYRTGMILSLKKDLNFNSEKSVAKDELYEMYITFDYARLSENLKYYLIDKDLEGNEYNFLKKAYFLYNIGQHIEAYEILKKISAHSFSRKRYLFYFIAQFNIKQLLCLIEFDDTFIKANDQYYKKILKEVEAIDIEAKYMELPKQYKEKISFITRLNSFHYFYKQAINLQEKIKSIKKQKI